MANTLQCLKDLILHVKSKKKFHQCHPSAETDIKTWTNEILCVWIALKAKKKKSWKLLPCCCCHGIHFVNSDLLGFKVDKTPALCVLAVLVFSLMEPAFRYLLQTSIDWFPDKRSWKSKSLARLVVQAHRASGSSRHADTAAFKI